MKECSSEAEYDSVHPTFEGKGKGKPQASLTQEQELQLNRLKRLLTFKRVMAETRVSYYTFEKLGNGGKADAESVARIVTWLASQQEREPTP